jgi:hypothetical protein
MVDKVSVSNLILEGLEEAAEFGAKLTHLNDNPVLEAKGRN